MSYRVDLTRAAVRELRRVPKPFHDAIVLALRGLEEVPPPAGCKKLVGYEGSWRIRVGSYRVLDGISDTIRLISVERIADRKDAYR